MGLLDLDILGSVGGILDGLFGGLGANGLLVVLLFVFTILFIYKAVKLLMHTGMAAIAGAAFPFIANTFFGLSLEITLERILFFAAAAVALFLAGTALKSVWGITKGILRL